MNLFDLRAFVIWNMKALDAYGYMYGIYVWHLMTFVYMYVCARLQNLYHGFYVTWVWSLGAKNEALLSVQNEKSRSEWGMLSDNKSMGGSPG